MKFQICIKFTCNYKTLPDFNFSIERVVCSVFVFWRTVKSYFMFSVWSVISYTLFWLRKMIFKISLFFSYALLLSEVSQVPLWNFIFNFSTLKPKCRFRFLSSSFHLLFLASDDEDINRWVENGLQVEKYFDSGLNLSQQDWNILVEWNYPIQGKRSQFFYFNYVKVLSFFNSWNSQTLPKNENDVIS